MTDSTPEPTPGNAWTIFAAVLGIAGLVIGLLLLLIPSVDSFGDAADLDLPRLLTGIAVTCVGGTFTACALLLAGIGHFSQPNRLPPQYIAVTGDGPK